MAGTYIVAGARTPIGKMSGALADCTAVELGSVAIRAAMERAGVSPDVIDFVFMGHVIQAGTGQITARQAAVSAGIGLDRPATTVNRVCLSGMNSIYLADLMINAGEADVVVAGGMESFTGSPYLLPKGRGGLRYGDGVVLDSIIADALTCPFEHHAMGTGTSRDAKAAGISRQAQDDFAAASHERAAAAIKEGRMADEIVPVKIAQRRGGEIVVDTDEGVRPGTTSESLSKLKAAFDDFGDVTAGNASQLSDGASAVIVASKAAVERLGLSPMAEILSYGQVSGPDSVSLLHQPSRAIKTALAKKDMSVSDVDLFEINEAFAVIGLSSMADLGITDAVTNVNGGAIALGHPVGMSGNRITLTLLHELQRRGGGIGAAALCGGGGQGDAIIVRTV